MIRWWEDLRAQSSFHLIFLRQSIEQITRLTGHQHTIRRMLASALADSRPLGKLSALLVRLAGRLSSNHPERHVATPGRSLYIEEDLAPQAPEYKRD